MKIKLQVFLIQEVLLYMSITSNNNFILSVLTKKLATTTFDTISLIIKKNKYLHFHFGLYVSPELLYIKGYKELI